jgi:O-methyltransferase
MDNVIIRELAASNPNMSDVDRLVNIYWAMSEVLNGGVEGAIVELGCNAGLTAIFLQMLNVEYGCKRELHLFDSFEGLPAPGPQDAYLNQGDCATSEDVVLSNFRAHGLPLPHLHKGWFSETLPVASIESVAFGYLDGDFYSSILESLEWVWPRLSPGGILLVDDYADVEKNPQAWAGLPGVKLACDEFFRDRTEKPFVLYGQGDLAFAGIRRMRRPLEGS